MAISISTYDQIFNQTLAFFRVRFPNRDLGTESFLGKIARATALAILQLEKSILDADNDSVPTNKTSTAALNNFAFLFGLSSGVAGQYGRKGAIAATGGLANCTGTNGTSFASGLLLTGSDGVTQFQLTGTVTIPGNPPGTGLVQGSFSAVTAGSVGNLAAGQVLTWQNPPAGADSTVTLSTGLSGGLDSETDAALLSRLQQRLQIPPKGGVSSDFRAWAESVTGVNRGYPYPLRGGLGSTHVLITQAGSGVSRVPSSTIQTNVSNYVNGTSTTPGVRPVTMQGFTCLLPFTAASGMAIRLRMTPAGTKYNFDWTDTAGYTVSSYSAGGAPGGADLLTLNIAASADLQAAVNAGNKPRLQILSTGAAAVNSQVQVTGFNDPGTYRQLILQNPLPSGYTAPTAGNTVYAGGPGVSAVATAVLAYIDGLGPSRAGGYADTNDVWEDTCSIARMTQIALDQVDSNGSRFYKDTVSSGVTINGAATNKQAADNSSNPPELLYAGSIVVTQ